MQSIKGDLSLPQSELHLSPSSVLRIGSTKRHKSKLEDVPSLMSESSQELPALADHHEIILINQKLEELRRNQNVTESTANALIADLSHAIADFRGITHSQEMEIVRRRRLPSESAEKLNIVHESASHNTQLLPDTQDITNQAFGRVEQDFGRQQDQLNQFAQTTTSPVVGTPVRSRIRTDMPVFPSACDIPWNASSSSDHRSSPSFIPPTYFGHDGGAGSHSMPEAYGPSPARLDVTSPVLTGGPLRASLISDSKIVSPPIFNPSNFLRWREYYEFRRDLYWYVDDGQIPSVTGINASSHLGKFAIRFIRESINNSALRTAPRFLNDLESHFAANNKENRCPIWMNSRISSGGIRKSSRISGFAMTNCAINWNGIRWRFQNLPCPFAFSKLYHYRLIFDCRSLRG